MGVESWRGGGGGSDDHRSPLDAASEGTEHGRFLRGAEPGSWSLRRVCRAARTRPPTARARADGSTASTGGRSRGVKDGSFHETAHVDLARRESLDDDHDAATLGTGRW